jgi:uncharacterized membrane protein YedE/YeeE
VSPDSAWPWWLAGPLIGAVVPLLLWIGGRQFGVSANLRHLCAACLPVRSDFFRYDWRREGLWNLIFVAGVLVGGFVGHRLLADSGRALEVAPATAATLAELGLERSPVAPERLVSWHALGTLPGVLAMIVGGFAVGFGARWAGGCTSGHAITGLASFELPSLVAVVGFFAGGLLVVWWLLPALLS